MKLIAFLFLLLSTYCNAQPGSQNRFGTRSSSSTPPRPPGFQWDALSPQSPTTYNNAGTVLINAKSFTNLNTGVNNGDALYISGTGNITITNTYFGPTRRNAITVENFTGTLTIDYCLYVSNKLAIEVATSNCVIRITNSQCINPFGAPECKGQFFQSTGSNLINSYIEGCAMENFLGEGSTEDWISLFSTTSSGTTFKISNCLVRGGGPSISGGGFMLGDHGGSGAIVENNKLLNPGNYQIAVSGGYNYVVQNNLAYSDNPAYSRIAMYAYGQVGYACGNVTFQNNGLWIFNGNSWWPGDPSESCGTIIGANPWITQTNNTSLTLAQLAFPTTIINLVDADRLWHLRDESVQFRNLGGPCISDDVPVLNTVPRPTSNAGSNQSIGSNSTTVNGSGSSSTAGYNYQWTFVSGPATPTISTPNSVSTTISGLSTPGVYTIRLVVTNNSGAADASWMTITRS